MPYILDLRGKIPSLNSIPTHICRYVRRVFRCPDTLLMTKVLPLSRVSNIQTSAPCRSRHSNSSAFFLSYRLSACKKSTLENRRNKKLKN